jgi:CRISPR-associated protein Cst2
MTDQSMLYSLGVSAQMILDMHSLNNEGGEGNQIQTRMTNIMGADRKLHNVNAISGDMFKHIQAEHLHRLAIDAGLPLSEGARSFNANRVNYDIQAKNELLEALTTAGSNPAELDVILQRCAITDLEGILVTEGNRSLPRKSVVEFGWVIGVPEAVETDTYFHVKYVADRSKVARQQVVDTQESGANTGQTIFHRPASSGLYAIVLNVEAARIGFNDLSQRYAITMEERARRMRVLLESILYTFVEPSGAMRSTQNPHIVEFQGVMTLSRQVIPAPCISPLKAEFRHEVQKIAAALNLIRPGAIEVIPFNSLGDFAEIMATLIQASTPLPLPVADRP